MWINFSRFLLHQFQYESDNFSEFFADHSETIMSKKNLKSSVFDKNDSEKLLRLINLKISAIEGKWKW